MSAIPMALSMHGWETGDLQAVGRELMRGIEQVADAGADFFVCPDNTAHIVLEQCAGTFPIPGLHIADVVTRQMQLSGWKVAGLLGTRWTMTGPVYPRALHRRNLGVHTPSEKMQDQMHNAIFDELCLGVFRPETTAVFVRAIHELKLAGSDCAILGCTEIPLIINADNSPLPVLDSTRLLATFAVREALSEHALVTENGWIVGQG